MRVTCLAPFTTFQIFKEQISKRCRYRHPYWMQELTLHLLKKCHSCMQHNGGASRDRTDDPLLAKQVLSQLSYGPFVQIKTEDCD